MSFIALNIDLFAELEFLNLTLLNTTTATLSLSALI